ncbi:hypothetical protein HG452_001475 [Candidatus Saccharibacteria bacterium]|nr:hypothetical protein [Candidatus Saccharibacteria bacterium]
MKEGLKKMINLITNWILSFLSLLDFLSFGILDNIAVIYSILIITSFIVFVKLDATIEICDIWKKAGIIPKGLILTGLVLNTLPQWYLWVAGVISVVLAYSLTPNTDEEDEEPSILTRICDILIEEYHKSDLKKNEQKEKPKKSRRLPPVQ